MENSDKEVVNDTNIPVQEKEEEEEAIRNDYSSSQKFMESFQDKIFLKFWTLLKILNHLIIMIKKKRSIHMLI